MLQQWGYEVLKAVDGAQARNLYQAHPDIQLIISDWMMPNIDGIDLCRFVRGLNRNGCYTYFILLTAKSQVDDLVIGINAGADDFIAKPFNRFELQARLHAGRRIVELENELARKLAEISKAYLLMEQDLEAAAIVQRSMLPPVGASFPGIKYAYHFTPCNRIGGDLFNLVPLDDSQVAVYILDVAGHGVPAALKAVSLSWLLAPQKPNYRVLFEDLPNGQLCAAPPKNVLGKLNSHAQSTDSSGKFITFLYGIFNAETKQFTYSRAGHPYPIHISGGRFIPHTPPEDIPLGIIQDYVYSQCAIEMRPGDRIYFYTDGISETENPAGEQFSECRIISDLLASSNSTLDESISILINYINQWKCGNEASDDVSILGIEING
jgi:sigma-B regulation protein RsbU (phosphoserine phosphatase)